MPIITISRQYGSGGSEVAERTAKALGWELLDNEVVDAVAARLGLSIEEVKAREERAPSLVERLSSALAMGSQEWVNPATAKRPTDEEMLEVTKHVVEEAISRGPVVIVGRGAQSMLSAREDALHVFCYAPKKALIKRCMERDKLGPEDAERMVDGTNKRRREWVKLHFNREWPAHEDYHLTLNTGWLGIDGAAQLIVQAAKMRLGA
ncbi:MAG: cytidylate kinase-like family protein [Gemmatimonadaceae bacterium]|nr:cytidylate kinase-like family protein [Gemmatimonadaceae bacterium]